MPEEARKMKPDFSNLSDESLRCRINRHYWQPVTAKKVLGAFETEEVCQGPNDQHPGCGAQRFTLIGNRGDVRSRRVKYPENYLSKDGRIEAADRDAMRLIVMRWDYKI